MPGTVYVAINKIGNCDFSFFSLNKYSYKTLSPLEVRLKSTKYPRGNSKDKGGVGVKVVISLLLTLLLL